jgi:hypothetical protein
MTHAPAAQSPSGEPEATQDPDGSDEVAVLAARVVEREHRVRAGRQPRMDLGARLRLLADLEKARPGTPIVVVARHHGVDGTYARDVLRWARAPLYAQPLFTTPPAGEGFGALTELGARVLALATRPVEERPGEA